MLNNKFKTYSLRIVEDLIFALAAVLMLHALCSHAVAQLPGKVYRIGYLQAPPASAVATRTEAFRQGLRDLRYVEGKNVVIESRFAEGNLDRVPQIVAEFVRLKVDVIVTGGSFATGAAKEATSTIPIVMTQDSDPVGNGYVASLARPGGNVTGLSTLAPQLSGKQMELLKETVPKLLRVAVVGSSNRSGNAQSVKETEHAADALRVKLYYLDILTPKDIEPAFRSAKNQNADALLVLTGPLVTSQRSDIIRLAAKNRLPAIYDRAEFVEDGGLMTYSVSSTDLFRRAAHYVDKILKGAKPGDLPVEQPTKFELVINLKTAKQIGLTIPPNVLARADKVIK
jgi:putative tryptophan/tyrosine transport system substrate-binding protein